MTWWTERIEIATNDHNKRKGKRVLILLSPLCVLAVFAVLSGLGSSLTQQAASKSNVQVTSPTAQEAATQKSFPATNSEKGCLKLGMIVSTRLDQLNEFNEASCSKIKGYAKGNAQNCMMLTAATYNSMHGQPDLSRVPKDALEGILIGCAMMVYGFSEESAEQIRKNARR